MFKPPPFHVPDGRPRHSYGLYPSFPLGVGFEAPAGMGAPIVPPTPQMQLRGGFPPVLQGGVYHILPPGLPSSTSLLCPSPVPLYRSVTLSPPFTIPKEANLPSIPNPAPPPPPPVPKDPEMLKNIEILSFFVVKNGPEFENMARTKQARDPKFSFLFGGDKGTDAALGFDFYNWKKQHLAWIEGRSKAPPAEQERITKPNLQEQLNVIAQVKPATEALSPGEGSDMDMEDDFAPTDPNNDKDPTLDSSAAILVALGGAKSGRSSSSPPERRSSVPSPATQKRPDLSNQVPERRLFSATESTASGSTMGHKWNASNERELPPHRTSRGFSNQDSRLDVQPSGSNSQGNTQRFVAELSHKDDASEGQRRREHTRCLDAHFSHHGIERPPPPSSSIVKAQWIRTSCR